ncbi:GxxExxY protein, partial [Ferruginibacter sp.]
MRQNIIKKYDSRKVQGIRAIILDSCIVVHRELGPGLLESVYVFALLKEFEIRNIRAIAKIALPLFYKGYDTGKYYE